MTPQITPFLWLDADPIEVRDHYAAIFDDLEPLELMSSGDDVVIGASFRLGGREYSVFNGGPQFPQTEAFSLMIYTDDQEQTDGYWDALIADGGAESACGWLKDKYGVSWQVTPRVLMDYLAGDDAEGRKRAFDVMLTMRKLIIADLEAAYKGA
jgi:predicted 3-demethylubiquinone-9 3-methyltransferase (glyoxalase superfamily)